MPSSFLQPILVSSGCRPSALALTRPCFWTFSEEFIFRYRHRHISLSKPLPHRCFDTEITSAARKMLLFQVPRHCTDEMYLQPSYLPSPTSFQGCFIVSRKRQQAYLKSLSVHLYFELCPAIYLSPFSKGGHRDDFSAVNMHSPPRPYL